MTLSLSTITSPILPNFIFTEFTVSDGVDIVAGGYPLPRTWATEQEAAAVMSGMCWSPRRFAGPFRVIPVTVHRTKHGTVLSVAA